MRIDDGQNLLLLLRRDTIFDVTQSFDLTDVFEQHQQYQVLLQLVHLSSFSIDHLYKNFNLLMKSTQQPVEYIPPPKEQESYSEIMRRMEEELSLNCFICSHTFNTNTRAPTIVCRRQHTYCAECIPLIQRARPNRCPECRFKIYDENIFINRPLFAICHFFPQLKNYVDSIVKQNERMTQEINRLSKALEEMKQNFEKEIEHTRFAIAQEGMNLQERQERFYTIAKEKLKEKIMPEIRPVENTASKPSKVLNPEQKEKRGVSGANIKRRYTKPNASTSKRKAENSQEVFNIRIHSYHAPS